MAQIRPSITSIPADSGAAPSVEDIQDRLPSICVDYLSHNWTEEDVWASWRNMTRHKHEIANGVRLENASWRTWQKQRNKLRTISPETLNWLKDSDVTWLYGPLHTANVEAVPPLKISSTDARLGIDRPAGTKPGILKHRNLVDLLTRSNNTTSPPPEDDNMDYEQANEAWASRPSGLPHTRSDTHLPRRTNSLQSRRTSPSSRLRANPNAQDRDESPPADSGKRHITFNTFVEQRISLDEPILGAGNANLNDSDSDDVLEMRSTSSRFSSASARSRRSSQSSISSQTIARLSPTMLKTAGQYLNHKTLPRMVYQPTLEYQPQPEQPAQQQQQQQTTVTPFDIPSPIATVTGNRFNATTEDDEYSGAGFDYFGGPDLTGSSPARNNIGVVGGASYGVPPAVQQPPAQPKWRQPAIPVTESTSSSSSSTSSLNGVPPPQPGRSILKLRPAPTGPTSPEPTSPPGHFNYRPSVATGIGGMYGGYDYAGQAVPIGAAAEERGRSTSRGIGSSQYDRTSSRGSSVSSSSSVARSPVDNGPVVKSRVGRDPQLDKVQEGSAWAPSQSSADDAMDVDGSPDRASTPTPHSSPQIAFRPLADTSPSSLPHNSHHSRSSATTSIVSTPVTTSLANPSPKTTLSRSISASAQSGGATVAHANINAHPAELSQPVDDDDGSTLIGRATNIANTAKDLLGALWYGAQDESGRQGLQASGTGRRHHRGTSLG